MSFDRLRDFALELSEGTTETIFIQSGKTTFPHPVSSNIRVTSFLAQPDLLELIDGASLIISHGGTGSVISCLAKGKKVGVMPRLRKFAEHNDDHQLDLISRICADRYAIHIDESLTAAEFLERALVFEPIPFRSGHQDFLNNFLDKLKSLGF